MGTRAPPLFNGRSGSNLLISSGETLQTCRFFALPAIEKRIMRIPDDQAQHSVSLHVAKENLMFHKKRFRSAIALILTLLLTVALAPVAVAQDQGPGPPPGPEPPGPSTPATPDPPSPGPATTPVPPVTPPGPPDPTATATPAPPDMGNGNGDGDGNGDGNMMSAAQFLAAAQRDCASCRHANPDKRARWWAARLLHRPGRHLKFRHRYRFVQHTGGDLSKRRRRLALHRHQCGLRQIGYDRIPAS